MKNKFQLYFFSEMDGRSLGILRIIFFLSVIIVFAGMPIKNLCLVPSELKSHLTIFDSFNDIFLHPKIMDNLLILWRISLLFCLVGFLSSLFMPLAFLTSGVIFSLHNAYSCGFHGSNLFFLGMGILMLSPAGKYISIDHLVARKKKIVLPKKISIWPVRLIQINFIIMFFFAAVSKYLNLGFDYVNGDGFYSILLIKKTWGGNVSWMFEYLLDHPALARIVGAYSYIIELISPLALFNIKLLNIHLMKLILISLGIMQILIYFNMGITSFNAMPSLYAFWINWDKVIEWYEKNKI